MVKMRLMGAKSKSYVWQQPSWPRLVFSADAVAPALIDARRAQGEVEGKAGALGIDRTGEVARELTTQEVIATAAIEGVHLNPAAVRSSVMRKLGLADTGPYDRDIDGLVEVISDAAGGFEQALDHDRLCRWQSALFPGGTSGVRRIAVGRYRDHPDAMQIVSGSLGKEKVHYQAPPSDRVHLEMDRFLRWFADTRPAQRKSDSMDGLARAAMAHMWFESVHPFEDGNGRIGRAIVEMAVAQDQGAPVRLYSLSRQLLETRCDYYDALNRAQCGTCDITEWVVWFAQQFAAACRSSGKVVDLAIERARFWADHAGVPLNERQRKVLQRLLDDGDGGFAGGLSADKYMKMTGASKATATRDLTHLLGAGLLRFAGQGRSVRYFIEVPGWTHGA